MTRERKDTFIILRVNSVIKSKLISMAGGTRKLSSFIYKILTNKVRD